jgi:hypothetical protein
VIDVPALLAEQRCDPTIAVTAIVAGQIDNRSCQCILVIAHDEGAALRRAWLSEDPAGTPLRDRQRLLHVTNRLAASFGA